jgi:hypothetical protein
MSKPRKFSSREIQARGECLVNDGEKIVDIRLDAYDDAASSSELRRYAEWLKKAADWLEDR